MRLTHIAVLIAVVIAVSSTRSSATETATSINLRDAAIPEDALKQLSAKRYSTDPEQRICVGCSERYVFLTRPASTNVVAALMISSNEKHAYLNPNSSVINYGVIPPLAKMTPSQADQLWDGNENHPQSNNPNRTYKLTTVNNRDNRDVFIDLTLKNNHIEKYRIRGQMLRNENDWQLIE
jgi:hypothetical protein